MKRTIAVSVLVLAAISGSGRADWISAPAHSASTACADLISADGVMWNARQTLVSTDKVLTVVSHSEQADDFNTRSSALYEAILQYRIAIRKFGTSIGCGQQ
jgi:hypothetical protein